MPKKSLPGNRSFGIDHQNGKGSASRVTDIKRYWENHASIDWPSKHRLEKTIPPFISADEL